MLKIYLIRHGKTQGNLSGKYIGARTDEPLCQEGIRELEGKNYPKAELLFVSPMKRCRQTGEILYPGLAQKECPLLKECDFGDFENKNYKELSGKSGLSGLDRQRRRPSFSRGRGSGRIP